MSTKYFCIFRLKVTKKVKKALFLMIKNRLGIMVLFDLSLSQTWWHEYSFTQQVKSTQTNYEVISKHSYGQHRTCSGMM
jgi:hypothetical protein